MGERERERDGNINGIRVVRKYASLVPAFEQPTKTYRRAYINIPVVLLASCSRLQIIPVAARGKVMLANHVRVHRAIYSSQSAAKRRKKRGKKREITQLDRIASRNASRETNL